MYVKSSSSMRAQTANLFDQSSVNQKVPESALVLRVSIAVKLYCSRLLNGFKKKKKRREKREEKGKIKQDKKHSPSLNQKHPHPTNTPHKNMAREKPQ